MTIREHTLDLIMAIVLPPGCLSMKNAMAKLNVAGNEIWFSFHQAHIKVISKWNPSFIDSFVDIPAWLSQNVAGNANHKNWLTSPIRPKTHVILCPTMKQWSYTRCNPFSSHWDGQYLHQSKFFNDCSLVTVTRLQSWQTTLRHVTSSFLKLSFGL